MAAETRRIKMSLFLMLLLLPIAAVSASSILCHMCVTDRGRGLKRDTVSAAEQTITIKPGCEVSLPCGNVTKDQEKCGATTWLFTSPKKTTSTELVSLGQIREDPDRLSVTADCSLVIKNVTAEDVGRYICRQYVSGQQIDSDPRLFLSVVTMHEEKINSSVFLFCTVLSYGACQHTVEWLYAGNQTDVDIRPATCLSKVEILHPDLSSQVMKLLQCKVTEKGGRELLLTIDHWSTCAETGENNNNNQSPPSNPELWLVLTVLFVALVALSIAIIAVIRSRKAKGNRTRPEVKTADPEGNVFYASIDHSMKSNERQVRVKRDDDDDDDDDEGHAVTYCTVKASPAAAAAGASADPSDLYAIVNKGRDKV